jgi:hypothetical protein
MATMSVFCFLGAIYQAAFLDVSIYFYVVLYTSSTSCKWGTQVLQLALPCKIGPADPTSRHVAMFILQNTPAYFSLVQCAHSLTTRVPPGDLKIKWYLRSKLKPSLSIWYELATMSSNFSCNRVSRYYIYIMDVIHLHARLHSRIHVQG